MWISPISFADCCLRPLDHMVIKGFLQARKDSNLQHLVLETSTLPIELLTYNCGKAEFRPQSGYPNDLLSRQSRLLDSCSFQFEQVKGIEPSSPVWKTGALAVVLYLHVCTESWDRTNDLVRMKHPLYQLSYLGK